MKNKNIKKISTLIACILIPLCVGAISGYATATSIKGWYTTLEKPFFNPPNYIFGPVWTLLYILMGVSLFLIITKSAYKPGKRTWLIYGTQLALNFCWSFLFFKFHWTGIALLDIILMWLFILFMILQFYRIHKTAAYLQIPYLLWVSFASILNASIWTLN
jgi:translocator protein